MGIPTIGEELKQLGAYAENGKLYDRRGQQITFFEFIIPEAHKSEKTAPFLQEQTQKVAELKKEYTVIVLKKYSP